QVQCVATDHAPHFVTPLTLETLSGRPLYHDLFDRSNTHSTEHISLKDWGDIIVVAPATANIIAKMAYGIADDALSTLLLAMGTKPRYVCPAMNTQMLSAPATQRNLYTLQRDGATIISAETGWLACGAVGDGRMAEPETIMAAIFKDSQQPLQGQHYLVTAGPTYEKIDSVRFIGNYSSGKMGFAVAEALAEAGATVDLVAGPTHLSARHPNVRETRVESAREMRDAAVALFESCQGAVLSAAVADYRPDTCADHKLKKQDDNGMTLHLVQNPDILATLGKMKQDNQLLIGFALETDNELTNAKTKLTKKNLDFIVLNSLRDEGAGFGVDTNKVTFIHRDGETVALPLMSKQKVAQAIVEAIIKKSEKK
ncbi:MAG: bifunctional phosphopantothenoylcysteine decarboxylase/phosphopantothenate--cysteine ligase CoaBC, partial [Bacteroidales bacterium]|nr:bifunctional phosphopantothenoylcysteine decarboxylase/phosphopantothenate--cysteine ligase CoaBC [Candidatus Colimorpha onthohippi]